MLGKQIGIIRHIDELGRIVLPKEVIKTLQWEGKKFSFEVDDDVIIIQPLNTNQSGRKLDELGRLVIPIEIRKEFKIKQSKLLEMMFYTGGVVLKVWEGLE